MWSKVKSNNHQDLFNRCRDYAFRLLKFRMRSENELSGRLKRKHFDCETIAKVISFLKEKRFIDDREFTRQWIADKLKRPLGLRRIKQELKIKGVEENIIAEGLGEVKNNYNEESIVWELARQRIKRLAGIEPKKARQRIYSYLLRRGFSLDIVCDVVKQL